MNKMNVKRNEALLVFNKYSECLAVYTKGSYWISMFRQTETVKTHVALKLEKHLEALIAFASATNAYRILNIAENEIALIFRNKQLKEVLNTGIYAIFTNEEEIEIRNFNTTESVIEDIGLTLLNNSLMSNFVRKVEVEANETALLYFDAVFIRALKSGVYYFWKNPVNIKIARIDLRNQNMEVNGQELLSKDKVQLRINLTLNFKVSDAELAVNGNKEYLTQLYSLAQVALRKMTAIVTIDELLENKDNVSEQVLKELKRDTQSLGVLVNNCNIKDIILPGEVRSIMNKVLIAEKNALANTITRREETASTRSLLNTAKLLEGNEMMMKLKEMEFMEKITDKIEQIGLNSNENLITQLKTMFTKN